MPFALLLLGVGVLIVVSGLEGKGIVDVFKGDNEPFDPAGKYKDGAAQAANDTLGTVGDIASGVAGALSPGTAVPDTHWNPNHKPIDKWIIPILQWASEHGWDGVVTSGFRTHAEQAAAASNYGLNHYPGGNPFGSNHMKSTYPGGAVDVTNAAQLASVLKNYPGTPTLVWGGPVIGDEPHFSHDGH